MSDNTDQAHGISQICPLCDESSVDDSVAGIDSVCETCGLVVSNDPIIDPSKLRELGNPGQRLTWSEDYSVSNSTEQNVATALGYLEDTADRLGLGIEERERSAEIYAEAAIARATDGRLGALVVSAAIVHAMRDLHLPVPVHHVSDAADVEERSLRKLVKTLPNEIGFEPRICRPIEYLPYFGKQLELDSAVFERSEELISKAEAAMLLSGRNPLGIAAAAVYRASGRAVTQRTVADVAGVTEETIRVRLLDYQQLQDDHE